MQKWRRGLLTICILLSMAMPVFAALPSGAGRITNPNHVSGREFSSKSSIAKKLDSMFAGDIGLYVDKAKTKLVNAALGTYSVPNNGRNQYWANGHAGTSCFAYANAFYAKFYDGFSPHDSVNGHHERVKATGKITLHTSTATATAEVWLPYEKKLGVAHPAQIFTIRSPL